MRKLLVAVDLDGTLCVEENWDGNIMEIKTIKENIDKINNLYDKGHIIVIYTGRLEVDRIETEAWLRKNGVKYHFLEINKLGFDLYIDEKRKIEAIEELDISKY